MSLAKIKTMIFCDKNVTRVKVEQDFTRREQVSTFNYSGHLISEFSSYRLKTEKGVYINIILNAIIKQFLIKMTQKYNYSMTLKK